jgi:hypothetical protein
MNENSVTRIICGLKKKQWENGRNYLRWVMYYTKIKARLPLCYSKHTHYDRTKIRALSNIQPGRCHCKNTFFWYETCVVWVTLTDVSNEHTASTSKAEDGGSGFLQKPLYFDFNTRCLIAEDGILQRLVRPHNLKAVPFLIQTLESNQKMLQTSWYYLISKTTQPRTKPSLPKTN